MLLHVQRLGTASQALVCLHGFLGSGDNLWPLADHLKTRRQSLLIDLRGHGRSPHGGPYTLGAFADDVAETLEAEGIAQADLVGHSLGGKVAMALALRHPERIRKLVVVDISAGPSESLFIGLLEALARIPVASLRNRSEAEPLLQGAEPLLETRRFLLKNLAPAPEGGFRWRMDLEGFRRDHDHLLEPLDAALPFPGPALLIKGSTSDQVHAQAWEYTHRLFPAMRLLELPGGHWIHVDARQAFLESVGAFLEAETPPPTHAALPTA